MTINQAHLISGTGALSRPLGSSKGFAVSAVGTSAFYAIIWIVGATVLTTAHALTGGRYQDSTPTLSSDPAISPALIKSSPSVRDPFPEFQDEMITPSTAWASTPASLSYVAPAIAAIPYRVTPASNIPNAPPVVSNSSPASAEARALAAPLTTEKKSSKRHVRTVGVKPAPEARLPGPGLIYMTDPAPAAAAAALTSHELQRADPSNKAQSQGDKARR